MSLMAALGGGGYLGLTRGLLGFGAGPHVCPGAFLARMETKVALEAFVERVADFGPIPTEPPVENPVFWAFGPQTLPVTISAE